MFDTLENITNKAVGHFEQQRLQGVGIREALNATLRAFAFDLALAVMVATSKRKPNNQPPTTTTTAESESWS